MKQLFHSLTKFERNLWLFSIVIVSVSFILFSNNYLTLIASLIGMTALIFVAKGYVIGQILTVLFAIVYGVISYYFGYYGEMATYLGMTSPMAILAVISWVKHPYKDSKEVEIENLSIKMIILVCLLSLLVTYIFYFILKVLNTKNLIISTISVTTSFLASAFTFFRSPYYALGYALNDLVLIVMWIFASLENSSYLPMVICFMMFFINDTYGLVNWLAMARKQRKWKSPEGLIFLFFN